MPHFLHQVAYSREGWQALVNNPEDRVEAVRPAIEKLGGKIKSGVGRVIGNEQLLDIAVGQPVAQVQRTATAITSRGNR